MLRHVIPHHRRHSPRPDARAVCPRDRATPEPGTRRAWPAPCAEPAYRTGSPSCQHAAVTMTPDRRSDDATLGLLRAAFPPEWREPPLSYEAVEAWELESRVTLPEPYRTFIAEVTAIPQKPLPAPVASSRGLGAQTLTPNTIRGSGPQGRRTRSPLGRQVRPSSHHLGRRRRVEHLGRAGDGPLRPAPCRLG